MKKQGQAFTKRSQNSDGRLLMIFFKGSGTKISREMNTVSAVREIE